MSVLHPYQFLLSEYPIPSLPTFDPYPSSPSFPKAPVSTSQPPQDISDTNQNILLKIKLVSKIDIQPHLSVHSLQNPSFFDANEHEKNEKEHRYKEEQASTEPTSPVNVTNTRDDDDEEEEISLKIFNRTDSEIRRGYIERLSYRQVSHVEIKEKTGNQMRQEYFNRLIYMKILKLEPAKKHQTILIFDWDDTLLCTTFVKESEGYMSYESIVEMLEALDRASSELISRAIEYGELFIITNADEGWVEESASIYLPRVLQVLKEKKVKVISARKGYESRYPCNRWKMEAFLSIKRYFDSQVITNIICIGDQLTEIDAAYVLARQFNRSIIKTIKFKERPKPDELLKEVKLVLDKLEGIYIALNHLKIRMEKKSSTNGNATGSGSAGNDSKKL